METYEINTWWDSGASPNLCRGDTQCVYNIYDYITTWINFWIFILLIVWIILWIWLICRKHKWEKWLWKRIVKWELIFIVIMIAVWLIASFILYYIRSIPLSAMPA